MVALSASNAINFTRIGARSTNNKTPIYSFNN
jgi:hypothetical protein